MFFCCTSLSNGSCHIFIFGFTGVMNMMTENAEIHSDVENFDSSNAERQVQIVIFLLKTFHSHRISRFHAINSWNSKASSAPSGASMKSFRWLFLFDTKYLLENWSILSLQIVVQKWRKEKRKKKMNRMDSHMVSNLEYSHSNSCTPSDVVMEHDMWSEESDIKNP